MPTIMRQINVISRCGNLFRADGMKDSDISPGHHSYFFAICRTPGISQEGLAEFLCINKSNVARTLSYLEEHGYVHREQSKNDRRVTLVYPTEKMEQTLPQIRAISSDWNKYLAEGLTQEEELLFHTLLDKVADRAQQYLKEKNTDSIGKKE